MSAFEKLEAVRGFLESHTVEEIPFPDAVTQFEGTTPPMAAFHEIVNKGYLSAPVYEVVDGKKKYTGFLDTRGLVSWVVFGYDDKNTKPSLEDIVGHGVRAVANVMSAVTSTYLSRQNPIKFVPNNAKLMEAAALLNSRSNRIACLDAENNLSKVVTQLAIIRLLYENRASMADALQCTVGELKMGKAPVISVNANTSTIDVFRMMERKNISGIAVVDDNGTIVSATSGSDLRLFLKLQEKASLQAPIHEFLSSIRQTNLEAKVAVLECEEHETLEGVMGHLAATGMHRIFVIDSDQTRKPIAVISLRDIIRAIVQKPESR